MKFHIDKIYLWFSPEDKRCITFENNKVNVVSKHPTPILAV